MLYGKVQPKTLPGIDQIMLKRAGATTPAQRRIARYLTKLMRWGANTKAFEYSIQHFVKQQWPWKTDRIDTDVRIAL